MSDELPLNIHPLSYEPGERFWMATYQGRDGRHYQATGGGRRGPQRPFFSCEAWARMCVPKDATDVDVYEVVVGTDRKARRLKPTPEAYRHRLASFKTTR